MATAKKAAASTKAKKPVGPKPGEYPGKIVDIDVSSEMSESFLEYAYSVIYSRALPDARDGLKPVHRRILHQMADMGLRPERGHVSYGAIFFNAGSTNRRPRKLWFTRLWPCSDALHRSSSSQRCNGDGC